MRQHPSDGSAAEAGGGAGVGEPIDITPARDADRHPDRDWMPGGRWAEPAGDWAEPDAGQDPPPGAPNPAAQLRVPSRRRRIALGAALAVGVAGAAVLGTAGWRVMEQRDTTLTPPNSVAGLTRDVSGDAAETAEYLRTALAAGVDLDGTVAAVYTDPASRDRSVLFFGGTALLLSPGRELDGVLDLLNGEAGEVRDVREVPAGELGGVMRCGSVTAPEGAMAVCGWADHGSVAVAMFPKRPVAESANLMRTLREQTQKR